MNPVSAAKGAATAAEMAERLGIVFVLILVCSGLAFLYWKKDQEAKELYKTVVELTRANTQSLNASKEATEGLKGAMENVKGSMDNVNHTLDLVLKYFSGRGPR